MQQPLKFPNSSPKPSAFHMRIADIISLPEDEDQDSDGGDDSGIADMNGFLRQPAEASCGLACASPRRMVSRLMRRLKERRRPVQWKEREDTERERERELIDRSVNLGHSTVESRCGSCEEQAPEGSNGGDPGLTRKDTMFNAGVACSLLFLVAASKNELDKMRELRADMQMFLHDVKGEIRSRDSVCERLDSKESIGSCLTNLKEVSGCSSSLSSRSNTSPYLITRQEMADIFGQSTGCDEPKKEGLEGMDQLQAELEAELERLQLQLDAESSSQSMKVDSNDSSLTRISSLRLGEVLNPIQTTTEIHGGVPPVELERRLHELLESQQQEKIKELESTLECLKQKLSEKELEVSWWKDTALLMSRHVPDPQDLA